MDGLEAMVHRSLNPPHVPLSAKQIESKFAKSKQKQHQYQFPRHKQSIASSVASSSLTNAQLYNLYSQNKNITHQQEHPHNISAKSNTNAKKNDPSKTKIMKLKEIQEYSLRHSTSKKYRLKITTSKNSPRASTVRKKMDLFPLEPPVLQTNNMHTPTKSNKLKAFQSRSTKKLLVLSARHIRKIQIFKFEGSPASHKKGIRIFSKEKMPPVEVRTISIF